MRTEAIARLLPPRPVLGAALSLIILSHLVDLSPAYLGVGHFGAAANAALIPATAPVIPVVAAPTPARSVAQTKKTQTRRSAAVKTVKPSARFMMPLARMVTTSSFGLRVHPITGDIRNHDGVDLRATLEEPVFSVLSGTVVSAGRKGGYGNAVEIYHPSNGTTTLYAHLNSIWVASGARVSKGHAIGGAGTTGISTGVHLHFAVRNHGAYVNPMAVLNNAEIPEANFQIARVSPRNTVFTRTARLPARGSKGKGIMVASGRSNTKLSQRINSASVAPKIALRPNAVISKPKPDLSGLERKMVEATAAAEKFNYLHQEGAVSRIAAAQKAEEASAATKAYNDARASL